MSYLPLSTRAPGLAFQQAIPVNMTIPEMIKSYVIVRMAEFIFSIIILFCFFMFTGQAYWQSGVRSIFDTIIGSVYFSALYEIGLYYLLITALLWSVFYFAKSPKVLALSVPSIFMIHSILSARLLYFHVSWALVISILAMTFFDAIIAWIYVPGNYVGGSGTGK